MKALAAALFLSVLMSCVQSKKDMAANDSTALVDSARALTPAEQAAIDAANATPLNTPATKDETPAPDPDEVPVEEHWQYRFLGFTGDGQYAGFESSGYAPGIKKYIEFCLVEVNRNRCAESVTSDPADADTLATQRKADDVAARFYLPRSGYSTVVLDPHARDQTISIQDKKYKLTVASIDLAGQRGVTVRLTERTTYRSWLLQQDKIVPATRKGVNEYHPRAAYIDGDKMAVLIEYYLAPDRADGYYYYAVKYLLVTGSIAVVPEREVQVVTGKLKSASFTDCYHLEFSCGDFGTAETRMSPTEENLWDVLGISTKDGTVVNPKYVGKTFEITYVLTDGTPCGDQHPDHHTVPLVTGVKMINL